jgi:hypothetical protein
MNPLFEMPELLTLSGDTFQDISQISERGGGCSLGCEGGCNNGCDGGGGDGDPPVNIEPKEL